MFDYDEKHNCKECGKTFVPDTVSPNKKDYICPSCQRKRK